MLIKHLNEINTIQIECMAAIVVRIRIIGPIRTNCPKWSDFLSEFDFWSELSIDDIHA